MQNIIVNSGADREQFKRVEAWLKSNMKDVGYIVQPFTSFIENELDAAKESYKFDFYQGNTVNLRPSEIRLNRNDLFFINKIGLQIYKQDVTASLDNYNYPLYTYPDPNVFNGNDTVNLLEWQALLNIWRGKLDLSTKPVQRIEDLSCQYFYAKPESNVLEAAFVGVSNPTLPEWNNDMGMLDLGYSFIIDGSEDNNATLTLGTGDRTQIAGLVDAANAAVTTRNIVRLVLKGFKVNNGALKVGRWEKGTTI